MPAGDPLIGLVAAAAALPRQPSPELRERVLSAGRSSPFAFVHEWQGMWLPSGNAAAAAKELFVPSHDRRRTRLLRANAGLALPGPSLDGWRALYVAQGRIQRGQLDLGPGDLVEEEVVFDNDSVWRATADATVVEYTSTEPTGSDRVSYARSARWIAIGDGLTMRLLAGAPNGPQQLFALKAAPASELEAHEHRGVEELYVLSGSCVVEGVELNRGDYHRATPGSTHHPTRAGLSGCELLVRVGG
jgi:anti-sigma factor ChrR (cupin superfamily)